MTMSSFSLKSIVSVFLCSIFLIFGPTLPVHADRLMDGLQTGSGSLKGNGPVKTPAEIASNIINVFLGFMGILIVVYFLYGGFTWMTAQGDTKKIETAQATIRNAVIGTVIILSSWAISIFVLNAVSKATTGPGAGQAAPGDANNQGVTVDEDDEGLTSSGTECPAGSVYNGGRCELAPPSDS